MNTDQFIEFFSVLDRGWLGRIIEADRDLVPGDRKLLSDALEEDRLMEAARTTFLLFTVLERSDDNFARSCAASLARRSHFFGGLREYMERNGGRRTTIGKTYGKIADESETERGIMNIVKPGEGLIDELFERVSFSDGGDKWYSSYYDYENGYLVIGNDRAVHHRDIYERLEGAFGAAMPPMMRLLIGSGISEDFLRVAAVRVDEDEKGWPSLMNGLLWIFERHIQYVNRAGEGELLFLLGRKPRGDDVPVRYGTDVTLDGMAGDIGMYSSARASVTLARNLHARPLITIERMIRGYGDGTMAFLEIADVGPLAFKPPYTGIISLAIFAGTDVTISTRGPSARDLLPRICSYLGSPEDDGGEAGGAGPEGAGGEGANSAGDPSAAGSALMAGATLDVIPAAAASSVAFLAVPL